MTAGELAERVVSRDDDIWAEIGVAPIGEGTHVVELNVYTHVRKLAAENSHSTSREGKIAAKMSTAICKSKERQV